MSRLCRLKNNSHGEDGQWAYTEILRLRAELEVEAADASRYRFLRNLEEWTATPDSTLLGSGGKIKWIGGTYSFDEIDRAIDEAMDETKEL